MGNKIFLLILILIFSLLPYFAESSERLWPIDTKNTISSSFGEPRPGRFHYGLDFRSNGETGKKIFALGDE